MQDQIAQIERDAKDALIVLSEAKEKLAAGEIDATAAAMGCVDYLLGEAVKETQSTYRALMGCRFGHA